MPRPARGRPPPQTTRNANDHEDSRGRRSTRTTRSTGSRLSLAEDNLINAAHLNRDAALDRLAKEDATTTASSSNARDDVDSHLEMSSIEMGRRAAATPNTRRRDTTGLDLADDSVFGDLDDSFEDGRVPHAPGSANSSFAMSSFKPRSRQSSFIGRNDPPIRPSSRGGTTPGMSSTFNIGMFRRRAREPSILGTHRKPRPERDTDLAVDDAPEPSSEEDDFAPEAESTPVDTKRRRTQPPPPPPDSERNSDREEVDLAQESATRKSGVNTRKRKSDQDHHNPERRDKSPRFEDRDAPAAPVRSIEIESDSDSELSSLASSPRLPDPRPMTPDNMDEVAAPPASSDSEDAATAWPDIHTLAKKRRRPSVHTPTRVEDLSDISSPPSLTHSPNFADIPQTRTRGRVATRRQPSPNLTTADLTSLLPKRRYKKARDADGESSDEEELDTTGLAENEDELSYLDTRTARRRKGSRPPSRGVSSRPASRAGNRANSSAAKAKVTPASAKAVSRIRTYSRRSSDKENESGGDDDDDDNEEGANDDETFDQTTDSVREVFAAEELQQAAKKFKEVDKWELDFEEVVQSSSPAGAR